MGKVVVSEFISLDGVVEDPGGAEDFERGGWAFSFDRGPEGDEFKSDELAASDALLLGRVTYEGFAEAWPSRSGEFADKFNNMPKFVVSTTLKDPEWNNSTVIEADERLLYTSTHHNHCRRVRPSTGRDTACKVAKLDGASMRYSTRSRRSANASMKT